MRSRDSRYFTPSAFLLGAVLAGCGRSSTPPLSVGAGIPPASHSSTFRYTGKEQSFKVPARVTELHVMALGGRGAFKNGGLGGLVEAAIPVTPGERLFIFVGGRGLDARGGFNGGAAGGRAGLDCRHYPVSCRGHGGGGASDIRQGGDALSDRVLVVGGGGGSGGWDPGFAGGGLYGGKGGGRRAGTGCCRPGFDGGGGGGGDQSRGGVGGKPGRERGYGRGRPGMDGLLGKGGSGGIGFPGADAGYSGGGGGGGYYGGGGGGGGGGSPGSFSFVGGGGGGGSSYAEASATHVRMRQGWSGAKGDGLVFLHWQ